MDLSDEVVLALVHQVEFYFSDENLPGDKFLLGQLAAGNEEMVNLSVIAKFRKIKKIMKKLDGGDPYEVLATALRSSKKLLVSEDGASVDQTKICTKKSDLAMLNA